MVQRRFSTWHETTYSATFAAAIVYYVTWLNTLWPNRHECSLVIMYGAYSDLMLFKQIYSSRPYQYDINTNDNTNNENNCNNYKYILNR